MFTAWAFGLMSRSFADDCKNSEDLLQFGETRWLTSNSSSTQIGGKQLSLLIRWPNDSLDRNLNAAQRRNAIFLLQRKYNFILRRDKQVAGRNSKNKAVVFQNSYFLFIEALALEIFIAEALFEDANCYGNCGAQIKILITLRRQ